MAETITSEVPALYALLRKLKPEHLTEAEWARRAGVSSSFFQDIKKGRRPRSDNLEKVVAAIGMTPSDFYALEQPVMTEVAGTGLVGASDIRRAFRGDEPLRALPLVGTAFGGDHGTLGDDVELVELHMADVLDYLVRPASLGRDPDAFAVSILSDSMAPKFEPGDQVGISPRSPVSIGDYVLVQLRGTDGDDPRVKTVLIKRLVRRNASRIELCQFQPEKTFSVDVRQVAAMHKVMGVLW